jgi:hypothetical protein
MGWKAVGGSSPSATKHGCRLFTTTATSLTNSTETVIAFDSEATDTDAYHDTVTNNSRITIPSGLGGIYVVTGAMRFATNATGARFCRVHLNGSGSVNRFGTTMTAVSGIGSHVVYADQLSLTAGDYLQFIGFQSSGGPLDASAIFAAYLIGS